MKLSCQEHLIPGEQIWEKWEVAQSIGFPAIELVVKDRNHLKERLAELRGAQAAGIKVSGICPRMPHFVGDFDPGRRADAIENLRAILSVAAELEGAAVITPASFGL